MGSHPLNLALRFLLELAALTAIGFYGWRLSDGPLRYLAVIGLPLIAAVLWGTFAVPDDPSRSGEAPVPVPGLLRLILELAFFGFAAWALYSMRAVSWSLILAGLTVIHYLLSYDRLAWLLQQRPLSPRRPPDDVN